MWRLAFIALAVAAQPIPSVTISGDADAARLLKLSASDVALLRGHGVLTTQFAAPSVPELFYTFPIPQSVASNAEARAELRAQGLSERDIGIGESVSAVAPGPNGYWFGKSVYNAEGESGQGGIGFLSNDGKYTMLDLPTLRTASVSALLVEGNTIWAGMFHRGERTRTSRGLLRYDRPSERTRTFAVPGIIHVLVSLGNRLFIGTSEGPYMLTDDVVTRLVWK